jgi:SAM-dependent MidA family methyltransferase
MSSYHPAAELPAPDTDQVAHSARLIETIVERIAGQGGVISFRDYMQACLYEPGLGYYAAGATKLGKDGDFITAPEISALFGQTWAGHIAGLFGQGLAPQILEFGAGSGRLALDILRFFREQKIDWNHYFILETSSDFRERQRDLLQQHLSAEEFDKIHWLDTLPEAFCGMVIGNEVLDAMPVSVVLKQNEWIELGVGFEENRFAWKEFSRNSEAVQGIQAIDVDNYLPPHYCTEINQNFAPWLQALSNASAQVVVELIDYGYERAQYYHVERSTGTLLCFYRHRSHPDPFIYPGLQDITAFVDFDAVADAALQAGFDIAGLTTQAQFLLANGLLDSMSCTKDEMQQLVLAQQVKSLTLPGEMGEKFKVIALQKNLNLLIEGF